IGRDRGKRPYPEICVQAGRKSAKYVGLIEALGQDPKSLFECCARAGLSVLTTSRKQQLLGLVQTALDNVHDLGDRADFQVVAEVGWHHGEGRDSDGSVRKGYVTPCKVYSPQPDELTPVLDTIERPHRWIPSGSLSEWRQLMMRAGSGN